MKTFTLGQKFTDGSDTYGEVIGKVQVQASTFYLVQSGRIFQLFRISPEHMLCLDTKSCYDESDIPALVGNMRERLYLLACLERVIVNE